MDHRIRSSFKKTDLKAANAQVAGSSIFLLGLPKMRLLISTPTMKRKPARPCCERADIVDGLQPNTRFAYCTLKSRGDLCWRSGRVWGSFVRKPSPRVTSH